MKENINFMVFFSYRRNNMKRNLERNLEKVHLKRAFLKIFINVYLYIWVINWEKYSFKSTKVLSSKLQKFKILSKLNKSYQWWWDLWWKDNFEVFNWENIFFPH